MDTALFLQLPLLFFSIIIHEYSHGAVADYFGDDTARVMGRLSLNPLPHVDPIGTLLLPIFCLITHAPLFGWAKPVPVNHANLRNPKISLFLVSAVGPLSNFFLAAAGAAGLWVAALLAQGASYYFLLLETLRYVILINLYLCVFNLLPVHPLDGSRVLSSLLPPRFAGQFNRLEPHGFLIVVVLMFTGLFSKIVTPAVYWLYRLLTLSF